MSTPPITAPGPSVSLRSLRSRTEARARAAVRGRQDEPPWSRPLLWLVGLLAGVLGFWGLTRNGYANTYYSEAAQAASRSWTAWITNALDVSGSDSLDKGPLSNMVMGLSGRVLGFSSFSMLLPEALAGVGSVVVLHNVVKRTLGHRPAILAALMLALTPIFVAMTRFNNPDAILLLTEIAAAWALVRALESGRTRHLLLCGLFVGLAFNTKMLEAYLVVPGLVLTYLIAGPPKLGRRLAQLTAAGVAMFAVSFVWYGAMMLLPAADRPWVGDTTDNSWFSLIFGANGLSRVSGSTGGPGGAAGSAGRAGPLRLFNSIVGGQIAWLIPLALGGLALGLWTRRRASADGPRTVGLRSLGRLGARLLGGLQLPGGDLPSVLHDPPRAGGRRAGGGRPRGRVGPGADFGGVGSDPRAGADRDGGVRCRSSGARLGVRDVAAPRSRSPWPRPAAARCSAPVCGLRPRGRSW